jgi:hypothetical protein
MSGIDATQVVCFLDGMLQRSAVSLNEAVKTLQQLVPNCFFGFTHRSKGATDSSSRSSSAASIIVIITTASASVLLRETLRHTVAEETGAWQ